MVFLKKIIRGSVIYQWMVSLINSYGHSFVHRAVMGVSACFAHSGVVQSIMGKTGEKFYYQHSLFYQLLTKKIELLEKIRNSLAGVYEKSSKTSFTTGIMAATGKTVDRRPFLALLTFSVGFSISYLITSYSFEKMITLIIANMLWVAMANSPATLEKLVTHSGIYKFTKYLLE